jgi:hypothetical protein
MNDLRPPGWSEYDAIQSVIEGVDEVAKQYEAKWGVGRLDLLVPDDLREKFRKQQFRFDAAIMSHDIEAIRKSGAAMKRAWEALDAVAVECGNQPLELNVWEVAMSNGHVAAFVQTNAEAAIVTRSGRYLEVWTLAEVARVIDKFPEIALAKQTFPGATVKVVRFKKPVDWSIGDEIPSFDDEPEEERLL